MVPLAAAEIQGAKAPGDDQPAYGAPIDLGFACCLGFSEEHFNYSCYSGHGAKPIDAISVCVESPQFSQKEKAGPFDGSGHI